jgi:hypothetical protein
MGGGPIKLVLNLNVGIRCELKKLECLASPGRRGAQHEIRAQLALTQMAAHQSRRVPTPIVERPIPIVEAGVVPARLGVAEKFQLFRRHESGTNLSEGRALIMGPAHLCTFPIAASLLPFLCGATK